MKELLTLNDFQSSMPYNPAIHHRHSIRLKGYDYSQAGLYFVTICVQNRSCLFGKIETDEMILNDAGQIATQCWLEIPQHYPDAVLHECVIMPNHVHGIIELVGANDDSPPLGCNDVGNVGAKNFSPLPPSQSSSSRSTGTSRTIGSIVRGFKIGVTKQLGYPLWQRNYYEHIIRNEQSHQNISNYIINNPAKWKTDKFYGE
jgi:REP element-mobilizing transposase RayT